MDGVFTLVQSSSAQSALPVLRNLIANATSQVLLFCLLYPPESLLGEKINDERVKVFDWTDRVPGYRTQDYFLPDILDAVQPGPSEQATIVIDSLDTLSSDINSTSSAYTFLKKIRNIPSTRLIVHTLHPAPTSSSSSSSLLSILTQTSFSSSLTHIIAHPTSLLLHISSNYLCPPPPLSTPQKFWSIFVPISQRHSETDKLVFGADGLGNSVNDDEFVVELLVRGGPAQADHGGTVAGRKKRTIDRTLQGWSPRIGLCELKELNGLQSLWSSNRPANAETKTPADPTDKLPFNLNLTPSQQAARAQVPLPYVHQGHDTSADNSSGTIFYDPDSADDIDDDDPDEDLDI